MTTEQPTLAVKQADIDAANALDDALGFLTDLERPIVEQAFARHRTNSEPRPVAGLREAAQRVVDDYPAAAGACASIEGGDGKPGWGSIRRLAEVLATHSPAPMAGEGRTYDYDMAYNGGYAAAATTMQLEIDRLQEALRLARPIVEQDWLTAIDYNDADWQGMSHTALEAIDAGLVPAAAHPSTQGV